MREDMVSVHLYGRLRGCAGDTRADQESVVQLEPQPEETVRSVLERTGIPLEEVCHIFLNGALLTTKNSMAPWLEYEGTGESIGLADLSQALDTAVEDGDRLGLFARDMALLVV